MKRLLRPYPRKVAQMRSMARELRRAKSLGYAKRAWFKASQKRYATVQLARVKGGWSLAYDGEPCTGPFPTRQRAIAWFARSGR